LNPGYPLPITFLSDFGWEDEYVGVVHGVIATLSPECRVIDLNHRVPRGNIRAGALTLLRAIQYLPRGVLLAVVDPGVGSDRKAVALSTDWGYLVGPDNGLLSPATAFLGGAAAAYSIENPDVTLPAVGRTFEGRDRFAPAAALLAAGEAQPEDLGPRVDTALLEPLLLPLSEVTVKGEVEGRAWWIDTYGNVQTNITPEDLGEAGIGPGEIVEVKVGLMSYRVQWVDTFADVEAGRPLLNVDSAGLMALAVREGRADQHFTLAEDSSVVIGPSG